MSGVRNHSNPVFHGFAVVLYILHFTFLLQIFELVSGHRLSCLVFESGLTTVTTDVTERRLFAGARNGVVYVVDLSNSVRLVSLFT